ncbi:MAG: RsmB/NOP family class I SAM-dependent RNA methyltransferase [Lachnospiraceae bacterium]|nr:RsmB/NOP family class I SAM-dependent RNA methyltransferase [Lachnospiraceae bacterium]
MHLPETYLSRMKALLSDDFQAYRESFDEPRTFGLRANTRKITPGELEARLPFTLEKVPWTENGFYYDGSEKPSRHPYYFAGLYYLQEPSAMTPAAVLPVDPGDRVLDLCAAPGGKSTELFTKLQGNGILFSNDISNSRAQALLKNLELFGADRCVIMSEDPVRLSARFPGYFDKILIDAPCSGEGMFRKEPSVVNAWVEHGNAFYVSLQKKIVAEALKMLAPGGLLLYSTCTFSPEEDENIVLFMKSLCPGLTVMEPSLYAPGFAHGMPEFAESPDPELTRCIRLFPHKIRGEGHFIALLKKPGERERNAAAAPEKDAVIPKEAAEFLSHVTLPREGFHIELRNDKLSLVPDGLPDLRGLRVMRAGLFLGEVRPNRFEPSQALAMTLSKDTYEPVLDLPSDDPRVLRYLKGETLDISDHPELSGMVLIMTDGFPLGFGKARAGSLKNHYLKGWRYQ